MKQNIKLFFTFFIILFLPIASTNFSMEYQSDWTKQSNEQLITAHKGETLDWLKKIIKPINAGRRSPAAKSNCTLVAEKCVRVLMGIDQPSKVPAKKVNLEISWREDEKKEIISHEVHRPEQIALLSEKEFVEIIDLFTDAMQSSIDLTYQRDIAKYIKSNHSSIISDIKNLSGSAESEGTDKTLVGLIYYYFVGMPAGHLANFYRDKYGNLFFVDAQNEQISEIPPTKVQKYPLRDEIFFFPIPPKSGYYIKKEPATICCPQSAPPHNYSDESQHSDEYSDALLIKQESNSSDQNNNNSMLATEQLTESNINITSTDIKQKTRKQYDCSDCDKSYNSPSGLWFHKKIHTNNYKHECPTCKKPFALESSLKSHMRAHSEERPFSCQQPNCQKRYKCIATLNAHINNAHAKKNKYALENT